MIGYKDHNVHNKWLKIKLLLDKDQAFQVY